MSTSQTAGWSWVAWGPITPPPANTQGLPTTFGLAPRLAYAATGKGIVAMVEGRSGVGGSRVDYPGAGLALWVSTVDSGAGLGPWVSFNLAEAHNDGLRLNDTDVFTDGFVSGYVRSSLLYRTAAPLCISAVFRRSSATHILRRSTRRCRASWFRPNSKLFRCAENGVCRVRNGGATGV